MRPFAQLLSKSAIIRRLAKARDGDVIIAHVNHPEKSAGAGLVEGILPLKRSGDVLIKLGKPQKRDTATPHGA